jgi:transcriptional regulator GlxA family with amidase domain
MVRAARQIEHREGRIRVADLARGLGLSRRQLERRFAATVGTSPKLAARIARFRGVVDSLHRDPGVSLAGLALRQGYSDQAHMTRDFVDFAHRPPGAYRQELMEADPG